MAYAQWVSITIAPTGCDVTIKNVQQNWGKFYLCGNKDHELPISDIEGHKIPSGQEYTICSCGRESAASGTEGSFDLYDGNTQIGNYYWDCPWGSKTNTSTYTAASPNYITQLNPQGNLNSGALGNVGIQTVKIKALVAQD